MFSRLAGWHQNCWVLEDKLELLIRWSRVLHLESSGIPGMYYQILKMCFERQWSVKKGWSWGVYPSGSSRRPANTYGSQWANTLLSPNQIRVALQHLPDTLPVCCVMALWFVSRLCSWPFKVSVKANQDLTLIRSRVLGFKGTLEQTVLQGKVSIRTVIHATERQGGEDWVQAPGVDGRASYRFQGVARGPGGWWVLAASVSLILGKQEKGKGLALQLIPIHHYEMCHK